MIYTLMNLSVLLRKDAREMQSEICLVQRPSSAGNEDGMRQDCTAVRKLLIFALFTTLCRAMLLLNSAGAEKMA
jgi:hypothetical protein